MESLSLGLDTQMTQERTDSEFVSSFFPRVLNETHWVDFYEEESRSTLFVNLINIFTSI